MKVEIASDQIHYVEYLADQRYWNATRRRNGGLPRGVLPSGILKMRKKCPGLKVRFPFIQRFILCFELFINNTRDSYLDIFLRHIQHQN